MASDNRWDAAVVGGGPAGLAAALWLGRYRCRTILFDSGEYRNRWVESTHGYVGHDGVAAAAIRGAGRGELTRYHEVEICDEPVRRLDGVGDDFTLTSGSGATFRARRVVLATGVTDTFPDVEGFFDHYGVDVFHCPSCDGYEARDRDVVVFGWSDHVVGFAITLLTWASSVTVVTDGHRLEVDSEERGRLRAASIAVVEDTAVELVGPRGSLRAVRLAGGQELPCSYAFFTIAHESNNALAVDVGCALTEEGYVAIGEEGETSVPGVYAAGDLVPGMQFVQVAAARGTVAGVSAARSVLGLPT